MKTDPFTVRRYPKWHLKRLLFTAKTRLIEAEARRNFRAYQLPPKPRAGRIPHEVDLQIDYGDTSVTPQQMSLILCSLLCTERFSDTSVIEVGSFRGVSTAAMARTTSRLVLAVDPYFGYGGSESDYDIFVERVRGFANIQHIRRSSGDAFRNWTFPAPSFVFIDAVHDYVNTAFDAGIWSSILVKGGMLALHDTDQYRFAGTRKAAFEISRQARLFAHCDNLTIFQFFED